MKRFALCSVTFDPLASRAVCRTRSHDHGGGPQRKEAILQSLKQIVLLTPCRAWQFTAITMLAKPPLPLTQELLFCCKICSLRCRRERALRLWQLLPERWGEEPLEWLLDVIPTNGLEKVDALGTSRQGRP